MDGRWPVFVSVTVLLDMDTLPTPEDYFARLAKRHNLMRMYVSNLLIDALILEDLQRKWADRVRYMRKAPAKSALQTRRDAIRECIADLDAILKGEPK